MLGLRTVSRWPRGILASTIVTVPVISTLWSAFVRTGARTASTRSFAIAKPVPANTSAVIMIAGSVPARAVEAPDEREHEGRKRHDRRWFCGQREIGRDAGAETDRRPKKKAFAFGVE